MQHDITGDGRKLTPDIHAVHSLAIFINGDLGAGAQDTLGAAVNAGRGIDFDGRSVYRTGNRRVGNSAAVRFEPANQIAEGNLRPDLILDNGTVNNGKLRILGQLCQNSGGGIRGRVNVQCARRLHNGVHGNIGIGSDGAAGAGAGVRTGIQGAVIQLDIVAIGPASAGNMVPTAILFRDGDTGTHGNGGDKIAGDLCGAADIHSLGAVDDCGVGCLRGGTAGAAGIQNNILQGDPAVQTILIDAAPAVLGFVNGDLCSVGQGANLVGRSNLGGAADIQVNAAGNRTGGNTSTAGSAAAQARQGDIGQIHIQLIQSRGKTVLAKVSLRNDAPLELTIADMWIIEGNLGALGDRTNLISGSRSAIPDLDALFGNNGTGVDHITGIFHRKRTGANDLHQIDVRSTAENPLFLLGLDLSPYIRTDGLLTIHIDGGIVRQGVELGAVGAGAQANLHGNAAADGTHILEAGVSGSGRNAAGVQLNAGSLHEEGARSQPGVRKLAPLVAVNKGAGGGKLEALYQQELHAAGGRALGVDRGQIILDPGCVGSGSGLIGRPGLHMAADLAGTLLGAVGAGGGILGDLPVVEAVGGVDIGTGFDMGQGAAVHITGLIGIAISRAGRRLHVLHPLMIDIGCGIRGIGDTRVDLADPNITAGSTLEGDLFLVAFIFDLDIIAAGSVQVNGLGNGNGCIAAKAAFVGLGLAVGTGSRDCLVRDLFHIGGKARFGGSIIMIVGVGIGCERCQRHQGYQHGDRKQPGDNANQASFHFLFLLLYIPIH